MKVKDVIEQTNFNLVTDINTYNKEICGMYCCDLLSFVMSHARTKNVWITVQTHMNIIAVASLLDLGCIIIPESIEIEQEIIDQANEEDIPILSTRLSAYQIFCVLYEIGVR